VKVLKKSILCCMIATMLLLGLSVGGFTREYVELPDADMYPEKQMAFDWLDQPQIFEKYGRISDAIWSYAELGMQEFKSSKLLADNLEEAGFKVERGAAGMPTCFVASYGSGKPVVGIMGEFDALPMISQKGRVPYQDPLVEGAPGHGCGHNQMCTTAAAAAIAVKQAIDRYGLRGTIKVFGSPAEETLISRPYMVRAGLFDGVDAVINNHGSSGFGGGSLGGISSNAMFSTEFTFRGVTSHGARPWGGKSALDAVEMMNYGANMLREHLYFTYRMHYVIPSGGEAPNVVPDYAKVWYFVRNTDERLLGMYEKVLNCAKAGALATGTELSVRVLTAIHQQHKNAALQEVCQANVQLVGMPKWSEEEDNFARAIQEELGSTVRGMPTELGRVYKYDPSVVYTGSGSTDVADVTMVTAVGNISIPGKAPGATSHHWANVATNYGSAVWKGINAAAKAMAGVSIDLMTKPELIKKARAEFEIQAKEYPYETYLPTDAVPPNDLNAELMEKYRPKMEPTYLQP